MDKETVYLTPDQLQDQALPPLTLCGGPVAPYGVATVPPALLQASSGPNTLRAEARRQISEELK